MWFIFYSYSSQWNDDTQTGYFYVEPESGSSMVQVGKVSLNEETAGLEAGHNFSAVVYKPPDNGVNLWGDESNTQCFKTYLGNDMLLSRDNTHSQKWCVICLFAYLR